VDDLTFLLQTDGVPILSLKKRPTFAETARRRPRSGLSPAQWRRLSGRTRRLLESGRARVEQLHIVGPLEFGPARRRSRD
jgi:hypothetical protein